MNNHFQNLEWVSQAENNKRAYENGLSMLPPPSSYQKLNDDQVRMILDLILKDNRNLSYREIGNMFNVTKGTVLQIAQGKIHKSVVQDYLRTNS